MKFRKELYSKVALLKAAYNYTDQAYLHLDSDDDYYYVSFDPKSDSAGVTVADFENEILAQSLRHEVYLETKNIRELMLARALATSVIAPQEIVGTDADEDDGTYSADEILKDWGLE